MDSLCKLCLLLLSEAVLQGNGREMDGKKVMGEPQLYGKEEEERLGAIIGKSCRV